VALISHIRECVEWRASELPRDRDQIREAQIEGVTVSRRLSRLYRETSFVRIDGTEIGRRTCLSYSQPKAREPRSGRLNVFRQAHRSCERSACKV